MTEPHELTPVNLTKASAGTPPPPPAAPPAAEPDRGEFALRFAAWLIDNIILGSVVVVAVIVTFPLTWWALFDDSGASALLEFIQALLSIVLSWLYYAWQESGETQATVGKRVMGLVVTTELGARLTFAQATVRYFSKAVLSSILYVGYVMALFMPRNQALHDMIARTVVVRR